MLAAHLAVRATAGTHFMPPSLLDSQLELLRWEPAEPRLLLVVQGGCTCRERDACQCGLLGRTAAWPTTNDIVDRILAEKLE